MKNVYLNGKRVDPDKLGLNLLFAQWAIDSGKTEEDVCGPALFVFRYAKQQAKPWVYLSGPLAAATEEAAERHREVFRHAAKTLRDAGINVVSPLEINPPEAGRDRHTCLRNDIATLTQCDMLALLPYWNLSEGVKIEVAVAEACGIEVIKDWRYLLVEET